jgi:hypothetical protein
MMTSVKPGCIRERIEHLGYFESGMSKTARIPLKARYHSIEVIPMAPILPSAISGVCIHSNFTLT